MKIENLNRAIAISDEITTFRDNLEVINKMIEQVKKGELGLLIQEYSDGSGLATDYFYLNDCQNNQLNLEILEAIRLVVVRHEEELRQEIDDL